MPYWGLRLGRTNRPNKIIRRAELIDVETALLRIIAQDDAKRAALKAREEARGRPYRLGWYDYRYVITSRCPVLRENHVGSARWCTFNPRAWE